jgi:PQQ-dependent dehydrogenase (s-GDH family)
VRYLVAALAAGLLSTVPAAAQHTPDDIVQGALDFETREIVSGLGAPWEIVYGPDDHLWTTERTAGRISRIDPETGDQHVMIEIDEAEAPGGQDGLLGLALHPELLQGTGNDYVYTAYTYSDPERGAYPHFDVEGNPHRYLYGKIVRLTYDADTDTLGDPVEIIAGLPASNDHNSGRLQIGPDGLLYFSIGDGGKGQLGNWCVPIESQRLPTADELEASDYAAYQGKVLRLNPDGSIPEDNPEIEGLVSHIYSYGHRNPQGLNFGPDGTLYSSEHGPKSDDEVNIIVPGGNYGWPHVAGFRDDMAYQFARWSDATTPCAELEFSDITIDPSVPVEDETAWTEPMQDPLAGAVHRAERLEFRRPSLRRYRLHLLADRGSVEPRGLYRRRYPGLAETRSSCRRSSTARSTCCRFPRTGNRCADRSSGISSPRTGSATSPSAPTG